MSGPARRWPPVRNVLLSTGRVEAKVAFLQSTRMLGDLGLRLYATRGTAEFLRVYGIEYLSEKQIDLGVINIPKTIKRRS